MAHSKKMSIAEFATFFINGKLPENATTELFEDFQTG